METNNQNQPPANGQHHAAKILEQKVQQAYNHSDSQKQANPYNQTHQQNFDWRKYHTAWQDYYQKYYHAYYSQQLKTQKDIIEAAAKNSDQPPTNKTLIARIKKDIRQKIQHNAHKFRRSSHFWPVTITILFFLTYLFLQFNTIIFAQIKSYISPGIASSTNLIVDPISNVNVGPNPKLIIPKINVDVPVDYSTSTLDENQIQLSLRDGATYYPIPGANALPGEKGNTVILGHSSNDIFNQGQYKFVLVLLDRLEIGDVYYLHYNNTRYVYKITEKRVIDPRDIAALQKPLDKPTSTLVTCTPPGTDLQRLLIYADQISPDPNTATASSNTKPTDATETIPGNDSSWLDNIWKSIFGE